MIHRITVSLPSQLHDLAVRPYEEGIHRINRAIQGVNLNDIIPSPIRWQDRVVSLVVGLALILPFVNAIIWIGMKHFGNPDILSESLTELVSLDASSEVGDTPPPAPILSSFLNEKKFTYIDEKEGKKTPASWTIRQFSDRTTVEKEDENDRVKAEYDPEGNLTYFCTDRKIPKGILTVKRTPHHLHVIGDQNGKRFTVTHAIDKGTPWIQQATLGFREFVLSTQQEIRYCAVNPKDGSLVHMVTTKEQKVHLPPYGEVLKINSTLAGALGYLWSAQLWFDPITGDLCRMEHSEPGSYWYQLSKVVSTKAL